MPQCWSVHGLDLHVGYLFPVILAIFFSESSASLFESSTWQLFENYTLRKKVEPQRKRAQNSIIFETIHFQRKTLFAAVSELHTGRILLSTRMILIVGLCSLVKLKCSPSNSFLLFTLLWSYLRFVRRAALLLLNTSEDFLITFYFSF